MGGRVWRWVVLVTVGFAQVAAAREYAFGGPEPVVDTPPPPPRFAVGGVTGPWTLMEFGFLLSPPRPDFFRFGPWTSLAVGWGFDDASN